VLVLRRGRDRVASLRLVAVLGGESNVDVLAGEVTLPVGWVEAEGSCVRRLVDDVDDAREPPAQSPA